MAALAPVPDPEDGPRRYVVRLPVTDHWSSLDLIDVLEHFPDDIGGVRIVKDDKGNDQEVPTFRAQYLNVVADIWLQRRRDEPDVTWQDVADAYSAADYLGDLKRVDAYQSQQAGANGPPPKAPGRRATRGPRPSR